MKTTKRQFLVGSMKAGVTASLLPWINGCKPASDSELQWLNWSSWQVQDMPNRQPSVEQLSFLKNAQGAGMNDSKLKMLAQKAAALPDVYLAELEKAHQQGFVVEVDRFGEGWAGLCQLGNPPKFVKIEVSSANSGYVFNHELGHALMYPIFDGAGGTSVDEAMLTKVFNSASSGSSGDSTPWDYALNNHLEYWACGFSSYYASQECRDDLRQKFPMAYEFFRTALAAPPTDSPYGSASGINQTPSQGNDLLAANNQQGNTAIPGSAQNDLATALQNLMNVMQMEYQMQASMFALNYNRKPTMDNIRNGTEITPNSNLYPEIIPGFTDLSPVHLRNFQVFLKVKGAQNHIGIPCEFKYQPYIKPGHAIAQVRIPSHQFISELVRGNFSRNSMGIAQADLELVLTDPNREVVDVRSLTYVEQHADGNAVVSPQNFVGLHTRRNY